MSPTDKALWHKAWTETRWYLHAGFTFLLASALALYIGYPDSYAERFPSGAIAVGVEQVRAVLHDGRSYIWLSWFGTSLLLALSALALALASTGIVKDPEGGAAPGVAYALSMPVSRRKLASVRLATGLLELMAVAILGSLLVSALARTQGQSFPVREAVVHALLAVGGVAALYGLFAFLSATLGELNKAILGGAILVLYGLFTFLIGGVRRYSVFRVMTGDTYFLSGEIPWVGLVACCVFSLALMFASVRVVERRDF
jgi:uncharacterized membrane protein YidH (DUF202 family)